jgi:hypothetical protein
MYLCLWPTKEMISVPTLGCSTGFFGPDILIIGPVIIYSRFGDNKGLNINTACSMSIDPGTVIISCQNQSNK